MVARYFTQHRGTTTGQRFSSASSRATITFDDNTRLGDRSNIAYSSSTITKGRAKGIVFATGVYTEIGAIASELHRKESKVRSVKRKPDGSAKLHQYLEAYILTLTNAIGRFLGVSVGTPLQKKLSKLAMLLFAIAVLCAIFVLGAKRFILRKRSLSTPSRPVYP